MSHRLLSRHARIARAQKLMDLTSATIRKLVGDRDAARMLQAYGQAIEFKLAQMETARRRCCWEAAEAKLVAEGDHQETTKDQHVGGQA